MEDKFLYVIMWGSSPVGVYSSKEKAESDSLKFCKGEGIVKEIRFYE